MKKLFAIFILTFFFVGVYAQAGWETTKFEADPLKKQKEYTANSYDDSEGNSIVFWSNTTIVR